MRNQELISRLNTEKGTEGEARRGARDETRERNDGRGAREGEREGELRPMEPAQEFMVRKGDESVIYGPLSTVLLPSPL